MKMRIVVADAEGASALAERLTATFGAERISLWGDRREVGVRFGRQSDGAILRVLDTVERWLDQAGAGFAEMWLGKRSYRIARWAPVETWQRPSGDPLEFADSCEARVPPASRNEAARPSTIAEKGAG